MSYQQDFQRAVADAESTSDVSSQAQFEADFRLGLLENETGENDLTYAEINAIVGIAAASFEHITSKPIDMLLFCPHCGGQHVDQPQPEKNWDNPPHRSHECQFCGWVWRPADVPTNGVAEIQTKGQRDQDARPIEVLRRRS